MTGEGKGETDKWVADKGAKYAYGYDKAGKLKNYFGVNGIPHVVIVDASGTVVYNGGAGAYSDEILAKATAGALPKPLWEWSPAAKGAKAALVKRQFKAALDAAAALAESDDGPVIKSAIEGMVKSKLDIARLAYERGDFLGAESAAASLAKEFEGLPQKAEVEKIAADVKANPASAEVLKHQRQIAKIREKAPTKRKDIEGAIEDLKKIKAAAGSSYASTEAGQLIEQLRAALTKGR